MVKQDTSYTVSTGKEPVTLTYFPMTADGWESNKQNHPYKERLTPEKDAKPL